MVAYTKPKQRGKGKIERLREGGDKVKFIDLGFGSWQVAAFRNGRRGQDVL